MPFHGYVDVTKQGRLLVLVGPLAFPFSGFTADKLLHQDDLFEQKAHCPMLL